MAAAPCVIDDAALPDAFAIARRRVHDGRVVRGGGSHAGLDLFGRSVRFPEAFLDVFGRAVHAFVVLLDLLYESGRRVEVALYLSGLST
jgi:hypothetical protein